MASSLEKFFQSKVKQMPPVEFVLSAEQLKRPPSHKKAPSAVRGKRVLPTGIVAPLSNSAAENLNNSDKKPDLGKDDSDCLGFKELNTQYSYLEVVNIRTLAWAGLAT